MKLVVYVPNWVGDAVLVLPALHSLQQAGFELKVFGRPWISDLFGACKFEVHPLMGEKKYFSKIFRQYQGEYGISFRDSFGSAWVMRKAGIKTFGYHKNARGFLLHKGFKRPQSIQHLTLTAWELAKKSAEHMGVKNFPELVAKHTFLPVNAAMQNAAEATLSLHGVPKPYWVVCPFATDGAAASKQKIWPFWKELCEILHAKGTAVVICPSPAEEHEARDEAFPHAFILKGIRLGAYNAILKNAQQIVANDTGPMHMAAAIGAPVLGIFGISDPNMTRPWGGEYLGDQQRGWPTVKEVLQKLNLDT